MARQDANDAFLQTAFLYGANAGYIENLYSRYQDNPASVDAQWKAFFGTLKENKQAVAKSARGASGKKPNRPIHANGELRPALNGNWAQCGETAGDQ